MNLLNVLLLDIETSLMEAYVFDIKDQYIAPGDVKKDWHILAFGSKWLNEKKVTYEETRNGDDKKLLKSLWELLDKADVVITQNGVNFDSKKINARFMLHGFPPPKPYVHFDTYRLTKKVAAFTSHSLEYLTSKLCVKYKKTSHSDFPGKRLWIECSKGNPKAWKAMRKYNIDDVLSLEELYLKIRAWAPENMPKIFNMTDNEHECGTCGYYGQMRKGRPRKAKTYTYIQNSCPKCGSWSTGSKIKGESK